MLDRISNDLSFFQNSLELRATRQEVLSSNIANADTPNFKARDFDFKTAMQNAMGDQKRLSETHLTLTSARHIPASAVTSGPVDLLYRTPHQATLDGNTVEMDNERVQFADNTLKYQSSLQFVSGKIRTMLSAIQE
ncbi:MAG: flagellar basal body rod protein FlgB [Achromobacter sp.]|jgi:flagellar basal-body rod protein FlgB